MSTRTTNSIKNSAAALIGQMVTIILNFGVRTIFIKTLGASYLGINGLFTYILSVLSFAEIGFGTAIIYAMYAPIALKEEENIAKLMNYYAKVYKAIGTFIFLVGLLLIPFLYSFISDTSEIPKELPSLWIVYLLYLLNTSLSYFFNYKRSLVIASQNGRIDSLNQLYFNTIKSVLQIVVLFVFHDFLSFLLIQVICTLLGNYSISRKADKLFPFLDLHRDKEIDDIDKRKLKKNVFAMSFSKLGSVVITGVDNLLISKFVGIIAIGLYSNYLLITNTIRILFIQILSPITASVGSLVVEKSNTDSYVFFKKLFFINAYIAICCFVALSTLMNPFISLIWGENYVFSSSLTFLIAFNFYLDRMRTSSQIFIDAKGLFWHIKWRSVFEAVINLSLSLYFLIVLDWGVMSVVVATIISNLTINMWWEPYVVFKYGFEKRISNYYIWIIKYTIVLGFSYLCTIYLHSFITEVYLKGFLAKSLVSILIPNIVIVLFYHKTLEFNYSFNLFKKIINRG